MNLESKNKQLLKKKKSTDVDQQLSRASLRREKCVEGLSNSLLGQKGLFKSLPSTSMCSVGAYP